MNPFDLPGPRFLAFYIVVAAVVYLVYRLALRRLEAGEPPALPLSDPYQIAYLRGGTSEAARVAVLSLVDRGRLAIDRNRISTVGSTSAGRLVPIEQAILARCSTPVAAASVLWDSGVVGACMACHKSLAELRLVPDEAAEKRRWLAVGIAAAILAGIALVKVGVALSRGRTNVIFLVVLMIAALGLLVVTATRRRTALGDTMLSDVRHLFRGLRGQVSRAADGGLTSDAMLLAAVFGVGALPSVGFAEIKRFLAKNERDAGGGAVVDGSGGCGAVGGSGCGGGDSGGGGCGGCGS